MEQSERQINNEINFVDEMVDCRCLHFVEWKERGWALRRLSWRNEIELLMKLIGDWREAINEINNEIEWSDVVALPA